MSRVFVATETALHRRVVVKVLSPETTADISAERFRREIQVAAGLQHPHIVPLLTAGIAGDILYYTMPLVEGESLRARLTREGKLSVSETVRLLRDVADALVGAHARGLVHRDIKPDNVLISGNHAMVTDFGVAKAVSAATVESTLTGVGMALGTPAYMAPEQAAGETDVDARADLYALGCTAYEMLCACTPFTGSFRQVLAQHMNTPPEPIASSRADVPAPLRDLVMRLLEKDPVDRPSSAQAVVDALDALAIPALRGEAAADSTADPNPAIALAKKSQWRIATAVIALVAVAAVAVAWRVEQRADPNRRLVVVPPFENRTGDPSLNELGELAANWVSDAIVRDGVAEAVPSTVVQDLLGKNLRGSIAPAADLARQTGARTAIIGEYHRDRAQIEFRGALVAMPGAKPLLELAPVTGAAGSAALLNALELQVLQAVQSRFEDATAPRSYSRPSSVEAYRDFVRGEQFFIEGDYNQAAELHAKASALDTAWTTPKLYLMYSVLALGRVMAGDSLLRILEQHHSSLSPWDASMVDEQRADFAGDLNAAYQAAQRQFAQAPRHWGGINLAFEAMATKRLHEVLRAARLRDTTTSIGRDYAGWYQLEAAALHLLGDHKKELEVALERVRRFPVEGLSVDLEIAARAAMGQQDEVTRLLDQATAKPTGWDAGPGLAYEEFLAHGHEDMARAILPRVLSTYEGFATRPGAVRADSAAFAGALLAAHNYGRAREWWQRLVSAQDTSGEARLNLAFLAARERDRAATDREREQWELHPPAFSPGIVSYRRAQIAADLGDKAGAIALLRQAFAEGYQFSSSIHRDIQLQNIWNDPRFKDLMRSQD